MSTQGAIFDAISGVRLDIDVGRNLFVGLDAYDRLGKTNSLDADLVRLAGYIYAADLSVLRLEREQHLRSIELEIPVVNYDAFERLKPFVEQALVVLSQDNWTINFVRRTGLLTVARETWPDRENSTLMFSGGLDSFCGATELLRSHSEITLVSHVTHNVPVRTAQSRLAEILRDETGKQLEHLQVLVYGRTFQDYAFPEVREETQRTRSFLFVALSAIAARLSGARRMIVMAENGQFAIHLPLSEARVGSFSTHTAHPEFLQLMQQFLRELYSCRDLEVNNPFVYLTKSEVVGLLPQSLRSSLQYSTSCWMTSRIKESHCGICAPCLSRRIALETHGIKFQEYHRDLLAENIGALDPTDGGKRSLVDLCQFICILAGPNSINSDDELSMMFPELLNAFVDFDQTVSMYRRFANGASEVLRRYPCVAPLMQ